MTAHHLINGIHTFNRILLSRKNLKGGYSFFPDCLFIVKAIYANEPIQAIMV